MNMAIIAFRMLVCLGSGLVAFAGGLILAGIDGNMHRAGSLLVGCALVAWLFAPDPEARAAFDEFQKQRLKQHGIEI